MKHISLIDDTQRYIDGIGNATSVSNETKLIWCDSNHGLIKIVRNE